MKQGFEEVMSVRGLDLPEADEVQISGHDPVLDTRFKIGEACASVLAGVGVAASDIWSLKTGRRQRSSVNVGHAALALRSTHYLQRQLDDGSFGEFDGAAHRLSGSITQPWPTRDGRWFLPHFSLPHLAERVCKVLECEQNPQSVASAVARWNALELESAIAEARACGAMVRSRQEWREHAHGQAVAAKPLVKITKLGDSDPEPFPQTDRPLGGVRVLDLTRILAGPIAARTLAEHGADVLMVAAEHLPQTPENVIDTSHGKRSCFLDLRREADVETLRQLARRTDVFSQGYRPGIIERHGFGPQALAELRPGIVYLTVSCYGLDGPFSQRAGWEQVAQTVSGICHDGNDKGPALLPAAANDYTTGYLGAYGVLLALARRAREGGSYHVEVSLCRSAQYIYDLGKTATGEFTQAPDEAEVDALRMRSEPARGPIRHLAPVLNMSETATRWERPTPVLGGDEPSWPEV
ncbi:MAG: crotonobetainyl-CoA:carnitine CoA-transferase CaiB-like acyl-CoA transferase [Gammaproteobacteria bacterium]|jgi:crotonobetainyl-CoA:carnitine CoA-transferase CaiB-like acyl-CoA transferase